MLDRLKSFAVDVLKHHPGISDREAIMCQIEALKGEAQGLRRLFESEYRIKPKEREIVEAVHCFYENGLLLVKRLRWPWFSRKSTGELFDMLTAFHMEFEQFNCIYAYEASALNADFSRRMSQQLTRIIVFLLKIS